MIPFRFAPAAQSELLHEVDYYSVVRPGAGIRFQAAVEQMVSRARSHPLGGAPSFSKTRSMLVKGFPFNVIYLVEGGTLVVVAIAPHRKRPLYWAARLG